jgi:CRISPR-associated DxTHG motif protein
LRLIPYGRDTDEQVGILQRMASDIAEGDAVTLDVTHGLRHLPMLAQMSALYLRRVKNVEIRGLYYGALDMTHDGLTPVMNLRGLLDIADWTGAVQSFDKDGDYGVFASLMQAQSPAAASLLRESAFYERTTRPGQARGKLRELAVVLDRQPLAGIGALFAPTLRNRLSWQEEDRLYLRQQALARLYLEHDDFLRAALLGFEAFITRLMQQQGMTNPDNWTQRETVKKVYEARNKTIHPRSDEYQRYCLLRDLRNHLAHGNASPQAEIQKALASAEQLRDFLDDLLERLLP